MSAMSEKESTKESTKACRWLGYESSDISEESRQDWYGLGGSMRKKGRGGKWAIEEGSRGRSRK